MSPEYEAVEENKATGQIGLKLYYEYIIKGLGWFPTLVAILSILGGQVYLISASVIIIIVWIYRFFFTTLYFMFYRLLLHLQIFILLNGKSYKKTFL